MPQKLQLLIAEDNPADAELLVRALRRAGFEPEWKRVDTAADFRAALHPGLDLVLSDYEMPQFTGLQALELLQQSGLDLPFIIVSGTIGEETAVEAMRHGATDYLLKDRLTRLGPAVERALERARLRRERRKTIEEFRLFRLLVDQSNDTFEVIDPATGRFLDVNEKGPFEIGCSRAEYLAMRVFDLNPTLTAESWRELAEQIRQEGTVSGEGRHRRRDGTTFPIEFNAKWARLDRDYIVTVVRDTTERLSAEGKLRESERRFREMLENAGLIAMTLDREGRVTFCNDYLLQLAGWKREEVVGRDWFESFIPESSSTVRALFFNSVAAGIIPLRHENPIKTRHRGLRQISWNNTLLRDVAGNISGTASIGEDITERKHALEALRESEERFRQVVETIEEVFWMSDVEKNRIIYVSPGYEQVWGRKSEELYISSRAWLDAIHPEDRERVLLAATTRQATGDYEETYRIARPDGAIRWIRDRAFPVHEPDGRVRRVVGVAADITEQKQLEEQFLHAQRLEAIGTLASGIAHDLNNILAPMLMAAGLLKSKLSEARDRDILLMVEHGAQRGASVIAQLLTFSRGIAGARVTVQVRHLIKEIAQIIRETFPRNIELIESVPNDLWSVLADATQLHQVLLNLCVNARDALPRGGRLTLSAVNRHVSEAEARMHPGAKPGPHVAITVADTGTGIPPQIINRIFEPFFTTKGVGVGTGLGLSTVLGIVKSHGGFLAVESVPGKGTTFVVHLSAVAEAGAASGVATAAPPRGGGELILVVDDEPAIRDSVRQLLEKHDYRVLAVGDGQEAIEIFIQQRGAVRLVLTDMMMPKMDGIALIRALRVLEPGLKVLVFSGLIQAGDGTDTLRIGEVIAKPFAPDRLLQAIGSALGRPR